VDDTDDCDEVDTLDALELEPWPDRAMASETETSPPSPPSNSSIEEEHRPEHRPIRRLLSTRSPLIG
jgi:hypothetical protein